VTFPLPPPFHPSPTLMHRQQTKFLHAEILDFYLSVLEKLSTCIRVSNFKSVVLLVLEICLGVCQIL